MKKVLIFSFNYYPQFVGGAEVAIKEITDRIAPDDIEFHMVTLRFDKNLPEVEKIGNVLVHRIGFTKPDASIEDLSQSPLKYNKYLYQFAAAFKALRLHAEHRYSGIWAMMAISCAVPAAIFKLFNPKVPYVLTLQEGDPVENLERKAKPLWLLFTRGFTSADIIQPISQYLADWAKKRSPKTPIETIYNGSNPRDFNPTFTEKDLENYKQKLGKTDNDIYLVTTSRCVHKNGVDDVIRALPLLPDNVSFIIVGGGAEEESYKKLAKELGVEKRARFIGQVDRTETPIYRAISDIFVRPSRSEGFGISFASAMAARLPIIATQEGGIAEFLFDEKRNPNKPTTGWAVDKDSPDQIAQAVKDILTHPDKVKIVTDNAYTLAHEKYNWDSIAKDMKDKIFTRILK
ncbi:MAG: glycosyltransferase family 4 protein [Patescibacteria group bacterium]